MYFSIFKKDRYNGSLRRRVLMPLIACVFALQSSLSNASPEPEQTPAETQLTAIFLYQFSQFIKWPKLEDKDSLSFNICVDENPRLQSILEKITAGEAAGRRPIAIKKTSEILTAEQCQIIYFSSASEANLNALFNQKPDNSLTVTASEELLYKGAMIRLKRSGKRIRPQINVDQIMKTEISVSSKLMSISEVFKNDQ